MKSRLYFLLAKMFLRLKYWSRVLAVHFEYNYNICLSRGINNSDLSPDQKIRMLNSLTTDS